MELAKVTDAVKKFLFIDESEKMVDQESVPASHEETPVVAGEGSTPKATFTQSAWDALRDLGVALGLTDDSNN